jgi:hypothetical protein
MVQAGDDLTRQHVLIEGGRGGHPKRADVGQFGPAFFVWSQQGTVMHKMYWLLNLIFDSPIRRSRGGPACPDPSMRFVFDLSLKRP